MTFKKFNYGICLTNENEITKLNSELIKTNENINDVKNNWFNIETSPLWKKVKNENIKTDTWYIIDWTYYFIDSKQLIISNNKLTKSNIRITNGQIEQKQIIIENIDVNIDKVTLLYDVDLIKFIATNTTKKYTPIIHNIYQYIGTGTPTEFIAEDSIERDYYTKQETNNLLDKKQDKLIAGDNITIDKNNKISATGGSIDLSDYYKKSVFMKGYFTYIKENDELWINDENDSSLAISLLLNNRYDRLDTTNKTVIGAINELFNKKIDLPENIYTKEEVDHLLDDLSRNITDSHTLIINKCVKEAKEQVEQEIKDSKKETENEIPKLIDKALEKGFTDLINKLVDIKIKELNDRLFDNKEQKKTSLHFTNDIAIAGGQTFTYKNSPWLDNDNDIPNKKYVDEKLKEKWIKIAEAKNNEINNTFYLKTTYRVWYCLNTYPARNILVSATFRVEKLTPYGWIMRFYDPNGKDGTTLYIDNNTIKFQGQYKGTLCYLEKLQE